MQGKGLEFILYTYVYTLPIRTLGKKNQNNPLLCPHHLKVTGAAQRPWGWLSSLSQGDRAITCGALPRLRLFLRGCSCPGFHRAAAAGERAAHLQSSRTSRDAGGKDQRTLLPRVRGSKAARRGSAGPPPARVGPRGREEDVVQSTDPAGHLPWWGICIWTVS